MMKHMTLVVTSGPTREWIDPVRFISNPSSGKTGWWIAKSGLNRFKKVIYIAGPGNPAYSRVDGATNIQVDTTEEMRVAVTQSIGESTILIMSAAPADFRVEDIQNEKIKKLENSRNRQTIHMVPTVDILKSIANIKEPSLIRVGFAAETNNIEQYARNKIQTKNLDYICANLVYKANTGFGESKNSITIYGKDQSVKRLGPGEKEDLAGEILDYLEQRLFLKRENESSV